MKFITNHWKRNTYPFAWRLGWMLTNTKPSDWTYLMYCLRKVCLSSICHASSLWCLGWLTGESVGVTTGLFFKPSWLFVLIALRLVTDWPELCLERCDQSSLKSFNFGGSPIHSCVLYLKMWNILTTFSVGDETDNCLWVTSYFFMTFLLQTGSNKRGVAQ